MNEKQRKARNDKINEKYREIRQDFWPDVSEERLWKSKVNKYYATLPRALPLVCQIMDALSKGKPVSAVYYSLWCRSTEEALVIITDHGKLALEAGFSGQRALDTWKGRMKKLVELGFIKNKPGASGEYHYVLLLHPYKNIKDMKGSGVITNDVYYNTWFERVNELGASKDIN